MDIANIIVYLYSNFKSNFNNSNNITHLKMKNLIIAITLLFSFTSICQEQDYFIVDGEKTYCDELYFETNGQSYLKTISYVDSNGDKIVIDSRENIPNISTFYIDGMTIDKVPQNTDKPKKYITHWGTHDQTTNICHVVHQLQLQ